MEPLYKGRVGELAVAKNLLANNLPAFFEFGDMSRIDIITIINEQLVTIQIKATDSKNGIAELPLRKVGRWKEYNYIYDKEDFDFFALYVVDKDAVLYIKSEEALENKAVVTFRFDAPKNNQSTNVRYAHDYMGVGKLKGL